MGTESKKEAAEKKTKRTNSANKEYQRKIESIDEVINKCQKMLSLIQKMEDAAKKGQIYKFTEDEEKEFGKVSLNKLKARYSKQIDFIKEEKRKVKEWLENKLNAISNADKDISDAQNKISDAQSKMNSEYLMKFAADKLQAKLSSNESTE